MRFITFLNKSDTPEKAEEWEETSRGVIIPVGATSEVLVPWHRVLEIWNARGELSRD
jgi:hypothetical protein